MWDPLASRSTNFLASKGKNTNLLLLQQLHAKGQTASSGAAYYNENKTSGKELDEHEEQGHKNDMYTKY